MFFGGRELILFEGVVEDRNDPLFLGRVRVRVVGFHDEDKQKMPTDTLPWAIPLLPPDAGKNVVGYKEGDFVAGYFRDGESRQFPVILGMIPGIPEVPANPEIGYNDPTSDEDLVSGKIPRPPEMIPPDVECLGNEGKQSLSGLTFSKLTEEQKNALLDAQAKAEGADRPGTLPNRLNNPGAMVFADWQRKYGGEPGDTVGNRTFTKFPTREQGKAAQRALWESENYRDKNLVSGLKRWVDPDNSQEFANYTNTIHRAVSSAGPVPEVSKVACNNETSEFVFENEFSGKYDNPNVLPVQTTAMGQLVKEFGVSPFPYNVSGDGIYDSRDARLLVDLIKKGQINIGGIIGLFFESEGGNLAVDQPVFPISRYPLENQLKESIASRLARNEKTELTLVGRKRGVAVNTPTANHTFSGVGTDKPSDGESITEPDTPYNAKYPYNHVYESESGHVIEYDDTPLAERLHFYHRSGTFKEIHPDGQQVDKAVNNRYDIALGTANYASEKSVNITAKELLRALGIEEVTIESGDVMNQESGGDRNVLVGGNANTKVKENAYTVIDGDVHILIKGTLRISVEGDIKVKGKEQVLIDGKMIKTHAKTINSVSANVATITSAPLTRLGGYTTGDAIYALYSDTAGYAVPTTQTYPLYPIPPIPTSFKENDADNKSKVEKTSSTPKEGYILNDSSLISGSVSQQDLYKPESDSDGKMVVLSLSLGQQPKLYQALPVGQLEDANIQYKHKDGRIVEWNVKRPTHKKGNFIEAGRYSGNGNGGRDHWRFSKSGSKYPSPMVLQIGSTEYLILEGGVRHEAI